MGKGIVVFGSIFVDIKGYPITPYIPGGRNVGRVIQVHGGVSRNVAEDIANVDLHTTFISVIDDTGTSRDVVEKLNQRNVNTEYIRVTPDGLGTWLAVFDNSGDVVAAISKRPDLGGITQVLEEHGDEIFREADSIVIEMDMEADQLQIIFALARKYGKKVYAVVSNMSIAMERRDMLPELGCIVCNVQEAGILFSENLDDLSPGLLQKYLEEKVQQARIERMIITMGAQGAVFAGVNGESGMCPATRVDVVDTTGAGDAFFAGVTIGLTYGKNLEQSCGIGTRMAAAVIATKDNVCPRFMAEEFGLDPLIVRTEA